MPYAAPVAQVCTAQHCTHKGNVFANVFSNFPFQLKNIHFVLQKKTKEKEEFVLVLRYVTHWNKSEKLKKIIRTHFKVKKKTGNNESKLMVLRFSSFSVISKVNCILFLSVKDFFLFFGGDSENGYIYEKENNGQTDHKKLLKRIRWRHS